VCPADRPDDPAADAPGSPPWRLFIALPLPSDARRSLWGQLATYRERHRATRWLAPEGWHLTLLFLGSVLPARVPELLAIVDRAAARSGPFSVTVAGGGGRGHRGEAVAWLPVEEGAGRVIGLAGLLAADCPADLTSGAPPRRTPSAHLTVARGHDARVVEDLAAERWGRPEERWRADRVALLRSHLERTGARYETLHEATLYAGGQ
jgi:RNA 2',3'-cyclic 3'-phosphodiesterase